MKKKLLALVLSAAMTIGMLSSCAGKETTAENTAAGSREPVSEAAAQTTEQATEPSEKEVVSLRMIMYGDMTSRREEFFKKDFHDAVLKDLNIDLSVEFLA